MVDDLPGFLGRRLEGPAVSHQLNAIQQSGAAHVANPAMIVHLLAHAIALVLASVACAFQETFALDHVENRHTRRARTGLPPRVEKKPVRSPKA
jgi:hypothetical protein